MQESSLEDLLDCVSVGQDVDFTPVRVGDVVLHFLQLTDMEAYIDRQVERLEATKGADALPLWAKIWPASLPLAMYMQRQAPRAGDRVLEIGAGLGVAGMFAAQRGFSVVVSDNNPDALLFARINALQNNLGQSVEVRFLDVVTDHVQGRYSHIIASELLYREVLYTPLLRFLREHSSSGGVREIVLTADAGRRVLRFFVAAKEHFHIARSLVSCLDERTSPLTGSGRTQSESPKQQIFIYRLKPL